MQDLTNYEKRGYLHNDFRLFHLKDTSIERIDWHFHDFHKIILFLSGQASYSIEGKHYTLMPGDLVLIPQGCIHRPEIKDQLPYERMIIYISQAYLERISTPDCDLSECFKSVRKYYNFVIHLSEEFNGYRFLFDNLEQTIYQKEFGAEILLHSYFVQLIILVNRICLNCIGKDIDDANCDNKIMAILQYLNVHLSEPILIDNLAQQFYLSKYYMMRRFRDETGYTIHGYLTEKRLQKARILLEHGNSAQDSCNICGFQDYSAFARAFKKHYGISPSHYSPKE